MTGANSCLSILPTDVLMGRCESPVAVAGGQVQRGGQLNALQVRGTSSSSSLLWILISCRGSHRSGERLNGHGRRQQPVLARSLASLTVFIPAAFSSSAHGNTLLWHPSPHAWYGFVSVSCFTVVHWVHCHPLNVNLLWIHSFFPFIWHFIRD